MKKTTVRFAAVGTVLLLGALAIALAQHDSRQRARDSQPAAKAIPEAPQPILVDAIEPTFHAADSPADHFAGSFTPPPDSLVRANDNPPPGRPLLGTPPSLTPASGPNHNPLRAAVPTPANNERLGEEPTDDEPVEPLGAVEDDSAVALASGEGEATGLPSGLPALPSLPAGFGAQPLPVQSPPSSPSIKPSSPAPTLPSPPPSLSASAASLPSAPPSLSASPIGSSPGNAPNGPTNSSSNGQSSPTPSTTLGGLSSVPPGWVSSAVPNQTPTHQNLSDTQRPAMPATSLPPASRAGQQSWLQAPSMPSTGPSSSSAGSLSGTASGGAAVGTSALPKPGAPGSQPPSSPPSLPSSTLPSSASPASAQPSAGAISSRLSDTPASPPAPNPPQGTSALPSVQSLQPPAGSAPPSLGNRPLAPSATLGSPEPYRADAEALGEYYQNSPHPSGQPNSAATGQPSAMAPAQPRGQLASGNARSLLAGTALGSLVSNQPGNRQLDGSQNPIMLIQKRTAGECQVGKRATIIITVRNSGNATAHDVQVIDSVPSGASFAEAMPATTPTPEGVLVWQLGEMPPGDERTINLQIIPERQGELGSVASVRFAAQASVRTLATLPKLELTHTAAPDVLIGSQHAVDVVVKNVGTGVARNVRLEADLPSNIHHESGDAGLEASFGDIAPGESKHIRLNSIAAEAGQGACTIRALTDDGLQQEQKIDVQVLAPALQATISGPSKRYLDRQATFEIIIQNTGTASATNCEFMLRLPAGLNFNTANKHGAYDPDQHAVLWSVPEFPAGHSESVELTVLPVEVGTLAMTFQGMADLGVKTHAQGSLSVEEPAELAFTIEQDADTIELSASTTYTVEVQNVGRADHHVQVTVQLPPGSKILKVDPVKYSIQGDQLVFEPVPEMPSHASHKFRFEVQHAQAGTQIVRAQLKSQNRPTPVIKEEATEVYNDRN